MNFRLGVSRTVDSRQSIRQICEFLREWNLSFHSLFRYVPSGRQVSNG